MIKTSKTALERLEQTAAAIHETEERLAALRHQRDVDMAEARADEGATWRSIALASGLTEHGARKALTSAGLLPAVS